MGSLWKTMVNLSPTAKIATSLIAKDAVGCCLYVSQARSNEKFTPEQRADVANYDLANGVINIGLQLLAVKPIENAMKKVVDSKVMKHFFNNLDERLADPNNKKVMKLLKNKGKLMEGAVALLSVIVCQYFIKRVVSPFFSVPVGEKAKQWGFVKPKMYPEDASFTGTNKSTDSDKTNEVSTKPRFDVVCCADTDTNLINRAQKHYS